LIAVLLAVIHLIFFNYLDGRILEETEEIINELGDYQSTQIPQSYVTTISLALVTAFRAALIASIGICYTQYLWRKLRCEFSEVGLIEELFQVRANVFRLANPTLIRYAPVLCLIATLSWLLPVAMIYPPGALIVDLESYRFYKRIDASVVPKDGNLKDKHFQDNLPSGNYTTEQVLPLGLAYVKGTIPQVKSGCQGDCRYQQVLSRSILLCRY
jgi:hypothetical protein